MREFYASRNAAKNSQKTTDDDDGLLFSETPPDNGPIIDDNFVELVWHWVSRNPEVTVEGQYQPKPAVANSATDNDEGATNAGSKLDAYRKQRLCTGEDRVWYAIAGHGIDYKRIPFLEFQALSVIAGQGTKGVLQPDVTRLTGQDKRSLPKRTDNLAKNGYIVKTTVIARGTKTSLLKLKKFAGERDLPEDEGAPGTAIIQYNLWFDEMMRLLRENGNIMAFEDIRIGLGINKKRFETRALHRCVRRLAKVGSLRKVTARVEAPASQPDADMKSVRSLQLLRDPTEIDRVAFMRSDWQRSKLLDSAQIAQFAAMGGAEDDEDDIEEAEAIAGFDGEGEDVRRILNRSPPLWNPDLPFPNLLYNRIEESGIAGTSSSELYEDSVGQFWKRAMDEMLVKLTDLWQFSQPPHLRHLAIVKDTCQRGKQPTFQYRTYENFEKAVVIGDAFWEGVFGPEEKGKGKAKQKKAEAAAAALPDLDEWGFQKVNPKLFVGQNGAATLEECRKNAKPTLQPRGHALTPGSLIGRPPGVTKTPGSGTGRPKKTQTTDRTLTSRPRKDQSTIEQSMRKTAGRKALSASAVKRTADQADLDVDQGSGPNDQPPEVDQTPVPAAKNAKGRPRKSLRIDEVPSTALPMTPATGKRRSTQPVALDGSPLQKRRALPSNGADTGEERPEAEGGRSRATTGTSGQPVVNDGSAAEHSADDSDWSTRPVPIVHVVAGVEINPPGAYELKKNNFPYRGRPPKAKIAVFRSSRLRDFSWYVKERPLPGSRAAKAMRRSKVKTAPEVEEEEEEAGPTPEVPYREPLVRQTIKGTDEMGRASWGKQSMVQRQNTPRDATVGGAEALDDADMTTSEVPTADLDPTLTESTAGHASNAPLPDVTVHDADDEDTVVRQYKKAGVTKNIGALHIKRRKVALEIVQTCGGVFPGKGEMWFPFVTAWQRQYKQTPDRHTVDNVMRGLVTSGKLKKLTFFFKSRKGMTVERSIFTEPEIDPNSPKVKLLQKRIIDSYPATVLPEEVEIAPEFRKQAARNPQTTHHAKLAKAAGEPSTPAPKDTTGSGNLPPHYIRDQFPKDASVTVRRTGNGTGLGAIDAQLRSIKHNRRLASIRRGDHPRKVLPRGSEMEDGVGELTYEQALLQGEQNPSAYLHGAASKRSAARLRGSGRKLPGRILGSKAKRNAANATRTPAGQTKRSLPWDAIGYVASQAAHSFVDPSWMAVVSRPKPPPKRIARIQWKWVDPSAEDWSVNPSGMADDPDFADMRHDESASFGLLLPDDTHVLDRNGLSEAVDVQFAPQTIDDIVNSHMLPSSPDTGSDENEATKFFNEVERVQAWEQHVVKAKQALARGADRPFINHTTPSDIPWPLDGAASVERPSARGKRVRSGDDTESPQVKRRRQAQNKVSRAQAKVHSESDPRKYKKRDRKAAANFGDKEHDRLAKAVALVSVVAGGVSYKRNWMIVAHAFGYQFESEFLRHRWDKVRDLRNPVVKHMQAQIWEPFLDAYERGILPKIDYNDLEATDWPALMEWLEGEVITSYAVDYSKPAGLINKVPDLPVTREDLESNFLITETSADASMSRDEFFTAVVDKRRRDVATTCLNGLPLESSGSPSHRDETTDLLRSWARAVVLTDDSNYNMGEAYKKIMKFGGQLLDSTVKDLCAEKILQVKKKGRRLPGRNLKLDETNFLPMFKRWSDKQGPEHLFLTRVAKKRAEVLEILQRQDHYELEYSAEDELYVVLTNMVGQGLLAVKSKIPERNDDFDAPFPKITAWGYAGYSYNVRTFDKNRLRFSIIYEKTDKFTSEHGLRNDIPIPTRPPHFANEDGYRIPLWVDIHEKLLPRMWEMVVRSVLNLVVFRPGINAADIEEAHKGKIWTWEVELLMTWMEETGMAERVGPGEEVDGMWKGGWKVGEWWYCAALCPALSEQSGVGEM